VRRIVNALVAGVALIGAPAAGLLAPAVASADQAVVTATIFSGGPAGVSTQTVTTGALANCPTDSSPFTLNPGGATYQPAAGSAWSLGTIVQCGLRIPSGSLTDVAVQSAHHGFEDPLSPSDLTDSTHYQDPTAPQALPVISVDGGQNQVTYERPERYAGEANGADEVVDTGPVRIAVYENAPPLHVRITPRRLASATGLREQFTTAVTDASGAAVPAAALSFNWGFEDGGVSAVATPTHVFPRGRWLVTVVVTDHANGTGGTDTILVADDSRAPGPSNRGGAGSNRQAASPSGAVHGGRPAPNAGRTPAHARPHRRTSPARPPTSGGSEATPSGTATSTAPATTSAPATTTPASTSAPATTTPATSTPATSTPAVAPHRTAPIRRRRPRRITRPQSSPGGRLVRGLLIADVTPVAPAVSRLVHAAPAAVSPAPVVRAARRATALSGPIAVALLAGLLALGAARERRGRRRWRDLRPGL